MLALSRVACQPANPPVLPAWPLGHFNLSVWEGRGASVTQRATANQPPGIRPMRQLMVGVFELRASHIEPSDDARKHCDTPAERKKGLERLVPSRRIPTTVRYAGCQRFLKQAPPSPFFPALLFRGHLERTETASHVPFWRRPRMRVVPSCIAGYQTRQKSIDYGALCLHAQLWACTPLVLVVWY